MTSTNDRFHNGEERCTIGCGRSNRMNPIVIGRGQVDVLFRLANEFGGAATHDQMNLPKSNYSTINWLRYFGLVQRWEQAERQVGSFEIVPFGYQFMANRVSIPKRLWMWDKEIIERSEEQVFVSDILAQAYPSYEAIMDQIHAHQRTAPAEVVAANRGRWTPRNFE